MSITGKTARMTLISVLSLILITAALTVPAEAKTRARLSRSKLTVKAGKTASLKLTGTAANAKWSVSGRKLVTIKASGKKKHKVLIKAGKKTGTCYVKVKYGKKSLKCRVTVKALKRIYPTPYPKPAPDPDDDFEEKELSGTSVDKTGELSANAVTGKEADDKFKLAMTETSLTMLNYLQKSEQNKTRNILISPDSILTAMAMVENGARNNTLTEMETAFGGLPISDFNAYLYTLNRRLTMSKSVRYNIADSIWYKDNKNDITVNEEFLQKNLDFFGAQIFEAPFSNDTVDDINSWVYNKTRGMIPDILNDFSEDTVMILLNAIAFEGEWADKYYDSQVSEKPFYNASGAVKNTKMLTGTEDTYVTIGGAKGFIKPYAGNEIAFLGLEIPEGKTVDEFIETMTAEDFVSGYKNRSHEYDVITMMPEFKYDYSESLTDMFMSMGIRDAFNDFTADFTGITPPTQPVVISDVLHKTHIELDKNGTKAAAVTAIIVDKAGSAPVQKKKISVTLDHPFVYAIIDTASGIPLFIGTVKTL